MRLSVLLWRRRGVPRVVVVMMRPRLLAGGGAGHLRRGDCLVRVLCSAGSLLRIWRRTDSVVVQGSSWTHTLAGTRCLPSTKDAHQSK